MRKTRFTEAQIMSILREAEGGMPVAELCREHGISSAGFYKWRAKYGVTCPPVVTLLHKSGDGRTTPFP